MLDLDSLDIYIVDQYLALDDLNNSAKTEADCAFASSSSTDNPDSLACLGLETQVVEYKLRIRSVLEAHVRELDLALLRPPRIASIERRKAHKPVNFLLRNPEQVQAAISVDHP